MSWDFQTDKEYRPCRNDLKKLCKSEKYGKDYNKMKIIRNF